MGLRLREKKCRVHETVWLLIWFRQAIGVHVLEHQKPLLQTFMGGTKFRYESRRSLVAGRPSMDGARGHRNFVTWFHTDDLIADPGLKASLQNLERLGIERVVVRKDRIVGFSLDIRSGVVSSPWLSSPTVKISMWSGPRYSYGSDINIPPGRFIRSVNTRSPRGPKCPWTNLLRY